MQHRATTIPKPMPPPPMAPTFAEVTRKELDKLKAPMTPPLPMLGAQVPAEPSTPAAAPDEQKSQIRQQLDAATKLVADLEPLQAEP